MKQMLILFFLIVFTQAGFGQVKISELPLTNTVLATDPLIVVNGGVTKRVQVTDLMKTLVLTLNGATVNASTVNTSNIYATSINANDLEVVTFDATTVGAAALNVSGTATISGAASSSSLTTGPITSGNISAGTVYATAPSYFKRQTNRASFMLDTVLQISGQNGSEAITHIDSYGGQGTLIFRRSNTSASAPSVLLANEIIGSIKAYGYGSTNYSNTRAEISMETAEAWNDAVQGTRIVFKTTRKGASTLGFAMMIDNDATIYRKQGAHVAKTAAATLTPAELKDGIIYFSGGAAANLTMPLGTDLEAAFPPLVDIAFDFYVSAAGFVPTIVANTGVTLVGSGAVAANTSAQFRVRRTAANTFIVYRI